jgi:DnaJ-class molecular chaperone
MILFDVQVLGDENKRREYDTFGMSGTGASAGAGGFGTRQGFSSTGTGMGSLANFH